MPLVTQPVTVLLGEVKTTCLFSQKTLDIQALKLGIKNSLATRRGEWGSTKTSNLFGNGPQKIPIYLRTSGTAAEDSLKKKRYEECFPRVAFVEQKVRGFPAPSSFGIVPQLCEFLLPSSHQETFLFLPRQRTRLIIPIEIAKIFTHTKLCKKCPAVSNFFSSTVSCIFKPFIHQGNGSARKLIFIFSTPGTPWRNYQ